MPRRTMLVAGMVLFAAALGCYSKAESLGSSSTWLLTATALSAGAIACLVQGLTLLKARTVFWTILGLSACARIAIFPLQESDDLYRYIWEGLVVADGGNPYTTPPNDPSLDTIDFPYRDQINHPGVTAIYPPGMLSFFALLARISPTVGFFKAVTIAFDGLTLLLLLDILRHRGRSLSWALLYGIHPLILISFAGEVHLDVFLVFWMTQALWCFQRKKFWGAFASLGLAFHAKYIALLVFPFFLQKRTWRQSWVFFLVAALPFLSTMELRAVFESFIYFNSDLHFNGSLHKLAGTLLGTPQRATAILAIALFAVLAAIRLMIPNPYEGPLYAVFALLLFSPNVHFWYLSWLFPFLALRPSRPALLLSFNAAVCFATYAHYFQTGVWMEFPLLLWLEYLPVYALLLLSLRLRHCPIEPGRPSETLGVSLIVPVHKETMEDVRARRHQLSQLEHSSLETLFVASPASDLPEEMFDIRETQAGRGRQIATGIKKAQNELLVILHLDTHLSQTSLNDILRSVETSGRQGGACGSRFDQQTPSTRCIGWLNRLKAGWAGMAFGDQIQFIRADALEQLGGFPEIPLMEDVELSSMLREQERPLFLDQRNPVSSRSWTKGHSRTRARLVIQLTAHYLCCRFWKRALPETDALYTTYYRG